MINPCKPTDTLAGRRVEVMAASSLGRWPAARHAMQSAFEAALERTQRGPRGPAVGARTEAEGHAAAGAEEEEEETLHAQTTEQAAPPAAPALPTPPLNRGSSGLPTPRPAAASGRPAAATHLAGPSGLSPLAHLPDAVECANETADDVQQATAAGSWQVLLGHGPAPAGAAGAACIPLQLQVQRSAAGVLQVALTQAPPAWLGAPLERLRRCLAARGSALNQHETAPEAREKDA